MSGFDELMVFADDIEADVDKGDDGPIQSPLGDWKILVVDDEVDVHQITKLVLQDFHFMGKKLEIFSAYNEKDAIRILSKNDDISLVLLDVVMDEDDTGLKLARYIRDELRNPLVRIILRTGQPGQAPERKVIVDYDINDYKLKTELTADKLFVSVVTALRSFNDMYYLDYSSQQLRKIISRSGDLFSERKAGVFTDKVLHQFADVFDRKLPHLPIVSGFIAKKVDSNYLVLTGFGRFTDSATKTIEMVLDEQELKDVLSGQEVLASEQRYIVALNKTDTSHLLFLDSKDDLNIWDRNLMEIFIGNVKAALGNLDLAIEIEQTQKEMIFTLGEVAEARSKEMGNHVKRVSEYCRFLALKLGMDEEESDLLALATPVHDIGKLAIPDNILNKPGKLTAKEFEVMKTHAEIGHEMLKNSQRVLMRAASIVAYTHHEKWNGQGYPLGTQGSDTHIYGRIVALADVFDALDSDRVYKKRWPLDKIITLVKSERGEHFDPNIVDVLINNIDEFLAIRDSINQ